MSTRAPVRKLRWASACALLLLACAAPPGQAQSILAAGYDPQRDELIVDIAYRGTTAGHRFELQWGLCRTGPGERQTTVARLVDTRGAERAQADFRVRQRYALGMLECRPAEVTLRLGPVSHVTVRVPEAPANTPS